MQYNGVTSLAEVWIEIITIGRTFVPALVTSLAEVWIEISLQQLYTPSHTVTSLAEVWIEIMNRIACRMSSFCLLYTSDAADD